MQVLLHEVVIVQMGISTVNTIDFFALVRTQAVSGIETPDSFKQPLTPKHFVEAGDAARKSISRIEQGRVRVGDFNGASQPIDGDGIPGGDEAVTFGEQCHRAAGPHGPMSQQAADDAPFKGNRHR
jgi:hypothetical protein